MAFFIDKPWAIKGRKGFKFNTSEETYHPLKATVPPSSRSLGDYCGTGNNLVGNPAKNVVVACDELGVMYIAISQARMFDWSTSEKAKMIHVYILFAPAKIEQTFTFFWVGGHE